MSMNIPQQKRYKILLIGDSCIDKFHYGECRRLSPEAPVPVLTHLETEEMGGMTFNVRNNLLAFGDLLDLDVLTNKEIILKERFVDKISGQHIMRFDRGEDKKVLSVCLESEEIKNISRYDLLIISDYEKGFLTEADALEICNRCLLHDIPVFVDTKKEDITCYANSIVKINNKEFESLTNFFPTQNLVVTDGPRGARWNDRTFLTTPVPITDVSGAGDTFLAILALEYIRHGRKIEPAIISANRCASYVVQRSGTYSLKEQDIEELCL